MTGLLYLTPAFLLITVLVAGRYPGEIALDRLAARRRPKRPPTPAAPAAPRTPRSRPVAAARGGLLLARALAGRGPPPIQEVYGTDHIPIGRTEMRQALTVASAIGALALPAVASAHVSLHPNVLPAASNPTLDVRVPNEENRANVVKVDMQVPPGFLDVSTQIPPGWTATVLKRKLQAPVKTDSGTITEEVSEVIWTAPSKAGIPPGSFLQFPITTAIPDVAAGQSLTFKVLETYSNGDVVRWIEPADSTGHPAPTVDITARGGVLQDVAGTEAGPGRPPVNGQGQATSTKPATVAAGASKGLGIAALVLGGLALVVALAAIAAVSRAAGRAS